MSNKFKKISISIILAFCFIVQSPIQTVDAAWGGWNYNPGWWNGANVLSESCQFLMNTEHFSKSAAAGILGNFMSESGLNPYKREAVGNHASYSDQAFADRLDPDFDTFGPGRGLAQWGDGSGASGIGGSRWLNLVQYVNAHFGKNYPRTPSSSWNNAGDSNEAVVRGSWPSITEQLSFVRVEMESDGSMGIINSKSTPEDAAYYFVIQYERPSQAAINNTLASRKAQARSIYENNCTGVAPVISDNISSIDEKSFNPSTALVHFKGWTFNKRLQPALPTHLVANSYVIFLIDAVTGKELTRVGETFAYRQDVADFLSKQGYRNGGYGGFNAYFKVSPDWLGKRVYPMVRFASDAKGDFPIVEDNYMKEGEVTITKPAGLELDASGNVGFLESEVVVGTELQLKGWSFNQAIQPLNVTDAVAKTSVLILMDADTNVELGRSKVQFGYRNDVAEALRIRGYRNGGYGGFNVKFQLQAPWIGKRVYPLIRFASDEKGDYPVVPDHRISVSTFVVGKANYYTPDTAGNISEIDTMTNTSNGVAIKGWSFNTQLQPVLRSDKVTLKSWVFLMDAETNKEISRTSEVFSYRSDVHQILALHGYRNGGYGGFISIFPNTLEMKGKRVYPMIRYSSDERGDYPVCPDNSVKTSQMTL